MDRVSRLRCVLVIVLAACVLGFVPATGLAQGFQSTGCDSDQLNRIGDAIYYAGFAFISAGDDISNIQNGGDTTRFDNWFGDHSPDAVDHVYNTLLGAYTALGDASFDCGCNIPPLLTFLDGADENSIVAWTTHDASDHMIHLCPLYFSLDFWEFSVGELIHELTHLYGTTDVPAAAVCACPDPQQAQVADYNLALSSPSDAQNNADNYRYYALDWDPSQPSSWICPPCQ